MYMESLQINDHLQLERIKEIYAPVIFEAIIENRTFLRKWLPFVDYTQKLSDTQAFVKSIVNIPSSERDEVYIIWFKGEFAGLIGFKDTDPVNGKTELGYWIIEKMQGKGIVTKAVEKLIDYAFRKLKMNRIQIKVAAGNQRSAAIPKRLEFKFEGIEREGEKHQNRFFNLEIYSLLKKEWIKTSRSE